MKKMLSISCALSLCALLTGCGKNGGAGAWPVILIVLAVICLAMAALRTYSLVQYNKRARRNMARGRRNSRPQKMDGLTKLLYVIGVILLVVALLVAVIGGGKNNTDDPGSSGEETPGQSEDPQENENPPQVEKPEGNVYTAAFTDSSDPANWGIRWEVFEGSSLLHSYEREEPIYFGAGEDYFALPGIATFRGNNYRNSPSYGTAEVKEQKLTEIWSSRTETLQGSEYSGSTWTGSGWTGQPLIVRWDEETKQIMNLYADKKAKADLVEVIYATLDGNIYFLDLDDGTYTRDPVRIGMAFKGAGSLDPRGYPLMYVGSGDVSPSGEKPKMFIISLIDGSILYEGAALTELSYRQDNDGWIAFDSAPLVDAETDTLIWPSENGLLYTFKLNTNYNKAAGTISIDMDTPIITRYHTARSSKESYWYGYEASVNIMGSYLYVSENGGMFYCVDLNTMELVWAQDTKDDSNASPVYSYISETEAYIYTAPSLHWTKDRYDRGTISLYKLDAITGEIVWEKAYDVCTVNNLSGGVQATPLLGKTGTKIDGMVFYAIARTPELEDGLLVALDAETGDEVWRLPMEHYPWSSPVAVYEDDGTAYVVICDTNGSMFFLDGQTGEILDTINLGGNIQATPAAFENTLVVGTRKSRICGIEIS